ncbi:hypothetical protein CHLRE_07g312650v5 [Chlamydomonas reinhardtii]|uniref:Uncharacterized protein n=1 Tax=Chlamydomonas reinhardtii TaxID=3055 RepID=A0A2K3DIF9_CHLRE|nr:uncharacterized protein CHLRE_07g312650v5 [Chlamydomonas reinhardtii]PNW80319.1 hypothetical protein CHLRE_07g312650v5 [Chlamydomonas reinhardtii]
MSLKQAQRARAQQSGLTPRQRKVLNFVVPKGPQHAPLPARLYAMPEQTAWSKMSPQEQQQAMYENLKALNQSLSNLDQKVSSVQSRVNINTVLILLCLVLVVVIVLSLWIASSAVFKSALQTVFR